MNFISKICSKNLRRHMNMAALTAYICDTGQNFCAKFCMLYFAIVTISKNLLLRFCFYSKCGNCFSEVIHLMLFLF